MTTARVNEIINRTKDPKAISGDTEAKALSLVIVTNNPIMKTSTIAQGLTRCISLNAIDKPGGVRPRLAGNNKKIKALL